MAVAEPRALFDDAVRAHAEYEEAAAAGAGQDVSRHFVTAGKLDLGGGRQRLTLLSIAAGGRSRRRGDRRPAPGRRRRRGQDGRRAAAAPRLRAHACCSSPGTARQREALGLALAEAGLPLATYARRRRTSPPARSATCRAGSTQHVVNLGIADIPAGFVVPRRAARGGERRRRRTRAAARRSRASGRPDRDHVRLQARRLRRARDARHRALPRDHAAATVLGAERDYLLLEYAKGDKLFVPVEQLDRVTKYVGPDQTSPRVTRLNTADWSRATGKARAAAKKLAFDLVDLYARRAAATGYAFGADTPWQLEMEAAFPFEETPDQLAAIADVKADMESDEPMDRLVCGDVGYGKTEVAIRAAFKATQDGKQVMVLCPTTILAQQHFTTFTERFGAVPGARRGAVALPHEGRSRRRRSTGFADGSRRHPHRHAPAALARRGAEGPRPGGRRRGAAVRRGAQGAPQEPARAGRRAHAVRHPDPAHAADGARRACATCRSSTRRRPTASPCRSTSASSTPTPCRARSGASSSAAGRSTTSSTAS